MGKQRPRRSSGSVRSPKTVERKDAAVIFDLDDTLFDHRFAVRSGLVGLRRRYPVAASLPLRELESRYSALLEASHRQVMAGQVGEEEARTERFARLFAGLGERFGPSEAARRARAYRRTYLLHQRLVPGAAPLLRELRSDRTVVVLTNNRQLEQESKLQAVGAAGLIDALVTAEVVGRVKPHPGMFAAAVTAAHVAPEACVMVGDSWTSDIEGGRAAGLRVAWFNPTARPAPVRNEVPEIRAWRPTGQVAAVLRALSAPPDRRPGGL